jgi:hypothetical protein
MEHCIVYGHELYLKKKNNEKYKEKNKIADLLPISIVLKLKQLGKKAKLNVANSKKNKKFEVFDIIDAQMSKEQKEVYERIINLKQNQEEFSTVWATETQISNFIYKTLKEAKNDINNCYGEMGFNSVTNTKSQGTYSFKDENYGLHFLKDKFKIIGIDKEKTKLSLLEIQNNQNTCIPGNGCC